MYRTLTRSTLLYVSVAGAAHAAPPDVVPHEPVPQLATTTEAAAENGRQPSAAVAALARSASMAPSPAEDRYQPADSSTTPSPADAPSEAEREEAARLAIWNSEEMLDARRYVLEHGKRSARTSEREAQAFLNRLSTLSAEQMTQWLQRLQAQRRGIALQRAIEDEAREARTEESLAIMREQEAARQSVRNWQGRSAGWLQSRFETERALTQLRRGERADAIAAQRLQFNPFYPTLDPMTPPAKVAAAATLPGDLPRSDPRNFIRGEEGVDFGDGGDVGSAGLTAPSPAPSPAPPPPPSAAPVAVEGGASGVAEAGGGE